MASQGTRKGFEEAFASPRKGFSFLLFGLIFGWNLIDYWIQKRTKLEPIVDSIFKQRLSKLERSV